MIEGIVLAAGRSRRAGIFKPARRHRGRPLLLHAVDGLRPWCDRVIVVAGHRRADVAAMLTERPATTLAINPRYDDGMFSSVRAGVSALGDGVGGFFVLPVDCPLVEPEVYAALLASFGAHDGRRPIVPEHGGRGGHPVLLPAAARAAILTASSRSTLREVVHRLEAVRLPVASSTVLLDFDTPADFRLLAEESSR